MGIDLGSTTAKVVIFNEQGEIIFHQYGKHNTYIYQALANAARNACNKLGDIQVSCAVTGTAGMGVSERNGIKFVQEVIAATTMLKKNTMEKMVLRTGSSAPMDEKMKGMLWKMRPGPAPGSMPAAKTAGMMAKPAMRADTRSKTDVSMLVNLII